MNKSGQTAYCHHFLLRKLGLLHHAVYLQKVQNYWLSRQLPVERDLMPRDEKTGESLAYSRLLLPLYSYFRGSESTNTDRQNETLADSKDQIYLIGTW